MFSGSRHPPLLIPRLAVLVEHKSSPVEQGEQPRTSHGKACPGLATQGRLSTRIARPQMRLKARTAAAVIAA
jgi:hypothetical protein